MRIVLVLLATAAACGNAANPDGPDGSPGGHPSADAGPVLPDPDPTGFDAGTLSEESGAQNPLDDSGGALAWAPAPDLGIVQVVAGRDSAILILPPVTGARDYRAILVPAGVSVSATAGGAETVNGTIITCAGYRQHNAPVAPLELLGQIELTGLTAGTRVVIEAIDQACPFTGVVGNAHWDETVDDPSQGASSFSVYTEAEVRQAYGSLIVNGHGPSVNLAQPAPPVAPHVLGRTTVLVTPSGNGAPPTATFFEDWSDSSPAAQLKLMTPPPGNGQSIQDGQLFQNARWSIYAYEHDLAQPFIDRGQLHVVLADWAQDVFASVYAMPRRPVQLGASDYLHVTYTTNSVATGRRYWWMFLCGADTAGKTIDGGGNFLGKLVQTPFFMDNDGQNPTAEGWNCLQWFPRDGSPFTLDPDDTRPESDLTVMLNMPGDPGGRSSVRVASPAMYEPQIAAPSFYRQMNDTGKLVGKMLDDQLLIAPRTKFDAYISRGRLILYVNGEQRVCSDFSAQPLTMAEAALGFGQVLYHTSAEHDELVEDFDDESGERYILENTPYVDHRSWDDMGYAEHVAAPASFDAAKCFVYKP